MSYNPGSKRSEMRVLTKYFIGGLVICNAHSNYIVKDRYSVK